MYFISYIQFITVLWFYSYSDFHNFLISFIHGILFVFLFKYFSYPFIIGLCKRLELIVFIQPYYKHCINKLHHHLLNHQTLESTALLGTDPLLAIYLSWKMFGSLIQDRSHKATMSGLAALQTRIWNRFEVTPNFRALPWYCMK